MNMNRFEWMMVLVCGLGLAYVITTQKPAPVPPTAPAAPAAQTTGTPATPAPGTPATPAPAASTTPAVEDKETVIVNPAAEYTFTNIGGGIRTVKVLRGPLAGNTEQILNHHADAPIGALVNSQGDYDLTATKNASSSDKAITYTATVNGIEISKAWTLREGDAVQGWGYIWDLKLSFKNTGTAVPSDYYLHAGLMDKLHASEVGGPNSSFYADGSDGQVPPTKFDSSSLLGFFPKPAQTELRSSHPNLTWAGVHNQFYATLISPAAPSKERPVQILSRRKWVEFEDPGLSPIKAWSVETSLELPGTAPAPGATTAWAGEIYTGPRSGTVLNAVGGDRREAMHYGWFATLSRLFLGALNLFHKYVPFGLAIVFLTIAVRLVIWPLSLKATKSMKRMAKLSPLMQELKEKHKDDPQKMQVETMKLYKDYGVNPVGGCLPVLLQFPIFLGYFHMMQGAVEMRGHNFLWVKDLSLPDTVLHLAGFPINPLPFIMAITMYIQMKVAPQPAQSNPQMEMQQKIFKIMPLAFLAFCYNTASALALYWSVQNVISIFQTWIANKQPDVPLVKKPRGPSFLERAQAAALEQQQQRAKGNRPPTPGGGKSTFKKG
ncbi:MAG: 60 kDa inner rane insertion protein [Verrucomicrobiales bacterium]|nr:60 kDa inner rane insertion protein [Verrucomicrobiales bacterium]